MYLNYLFLDISFVLRSDCLSISTKFIKYDLNLIVY